MPGRMLIDGHDLLAACRIGQSLDEAFDEFALAGLAHPERPQELVGAVHGDLARTQQKVECLADRIFRQLVTGSQDPAPFLVSRMFAGQPALTPA